VYRYVQRLSALLRKEGYIVGFIILGLKKALASKMESSAFFNPKSISTDKNQHERTQQLYYLVIQPPSTQMISPLM
jgi:hypothetical protein